MCSTNVEGLEATEANAIDGISWRLAFWPQAIRKQTRGFFGLCYL